MNMMEKVITLYLQGILFNYALTYKKTLIFIFPIGT